MVHLIATRINAEKSLPSELCCNIVLWFQVMVTCHTILHFLALVWVWYTGSHIAAY